MRVLVVNAGSSSLKLSVLEADAVDQPSVSMPCRRGRVDGGAVREALRGAGAIDAVGHRIVHGGSALTGATLVDAQVVAPPATP